MTPAELKSRADVLFKLAEAGPKDAPREYYADEAMAWSDGYGTATSEILPLLRTALAMVEKLDSQLESGTGNYEITLNEIMASKGAIDAAERHILMTCMSLIDKADIKKQFDKIRAITSHTEVKDD